MVLSFAHPRGPRLAAGLVCVFGLLAGCAAAPGPTRIAPAPPAVSDPLGFVAVALGSVHGCALTLDGRVACWGTHHRGQLGDPSVAPLDDRGSATRSASPRLVPATERFVALDAGAEFSCALTPAGAVWCWGEGNPRPAPLLDPQGEPWTGIDAIAAGYRSVCGLRNAPGAAAAVHCAIWPERTDDLGRIDPVADPMAHLSLPTDPRRILASDSVTCVHGDGIACWDETGAAWQSERIDQRFVVAVSGRTVCTDDGIELRCTPVKQLDDPGWTVDARPAIDGIPADLRLDRHRVCALDADGWRCVLRTDGPSGEVPDEALANDPPRDEGAPPSDVDWRRGHGCAIARGVMRCRTEPNHAQTLGTATRGSQTLFGLASPCHEGHRWEVTPTRHACLLPDGRLDGVARHFDDTNGELVAEGEWDRGRREGEWSLWDDRHVAVGHFAQHAPDGRWTVRNRHSHARVAEGEFRAGVPVGLWTWGPIDTASEIGFDAHGEPISWRIQREGGGFWFVHLDDAGAWIFEDDSTDGTLRAQIAPPEHRPAWTPPLVGGTAATALPGPIVLDGPLTLTAGGVASTGEMTDGQPIGAWSGTWQDTGEPAWRASFGEAPAPAEVWAEDGARILHGACTAAWPHGPLEIDADFDRIGVAGTFADGGRMVGEWVWTDPNGEQRSHTFPDGDAALLGVQIYDALTGIESSASGLDGPCLQHDGLGCGDGRLPTGPSMVDDALTCPLIVPGLRPD